MRKTFSRDEARLRTPYPPEMLQAIKAARREKVANKTRELERERRGGTTARSFRRQRQGPPAHVLACMTPEERHMDRVARSLSEVGYIAQVKMKLGMKLRDPEAWKVEFGKPENLSELDEMWEAIDAENARRREVEENATAEG